MRIKALVYAALALVFLAPGFALAMGGINTAPQVTSLTVSPSPIPENGSASITCAAYDSGGVATLTVTVSGGTLPGGGATESVPFTPGTTVSGTIAWATPAAGGYTVTCEAVDTAVPAASSGPVSVAAEVVAAGAPPLVTLAASAASVYPGETVQLTASATSPDGSPLLLDWSATGGTLAPAGEAATWTAPSTPGSYTVSFAATNANGQATASAAIEVVWARPDGGYATEGGGFVPERVALDGDGFAYVTNSGGRTVEVFTPVGRPMRTFRTRGRPSGVAVAADGVWVTDLENRAVYLLGADGKPVRSLGTGDGEFGRPLDVAVSPTTQRVYVADAGARRLRIFEASGAQVGELALGGGFPVGVAVDGTTGRVLVADGAGPVRVFDAAGVQTATLGTFGGNVGQISRAASVAFGSDGNVYAVDALQNRIAAFSPAGAFVAFIGAAGFGAGQLAIPLGLAADARGRLVVSSTQSGRVDVFSLKDAVRPVCPASDSDCDGLPDAWELANGLNPLDPRDAWLDSDGDGLVNLQELAYGTDPRTADTDGDGYTDGEEIASGYDPRDAADHGPALAASARAESPPGLVSISSSVRAQGACSYAWSQVEGPTVAVRGASTATPSFVARTQGTYTIEGVATCGSDQSQPARVSVAIRNVPPLPDAGRMTVVEAGEGLELDASFTSDANGDVPSLAWDQVLGPAVTGPVDGAKLPLSLPEPGVYAFQLTASDAEAAAVAEVPVLVTAGRLVPTAIAPSPLAGQVGQPSVLDASASVGPVGGELAFQWVQREGPPADLGASAATATATFVPGEAGHYAFEVTAQDGGVRSPAARVDVYVAEAGAALPSARASVRGTPAAVGAPLTLDGAASAAGAGGVVEHSWRQLSGPPAGLTDGDRAVATVVPFATGTYVFELSVSEGAARSIPARVRFDVDAPGRPVALATAPGRVAVKQEVVLDGSASTAAPGKTLRYRWTQVAGPWVALEGAGTARPSFRPRIAGEYVFELEVDDGEVRSAPAAVTVYVKSRRVARGEE